MVEFGGLGLALVLNSELFGRKRRKFLMASAGIGWAVLDEIHQFFIPGRFCSFQDVLADTAGLLLALWLFSRLYSESNGN